MELGTVAPSQAEFKPSELSDATGEGPGFHVPPIPVKVQADVPVMKLPSLSPFVSKPGLATATAVLVPVHRFVGASLTLATSQTTFESWPTLHR